eukprot:Seg1816.9 transcript_id=Seg1816.9/GoldUCD/mRNA.D3Y31 product="E3 ubiquitin-protein ligase Mdm2" protein_id=Seg1816.9/GoldUCD/D3Y31
MFTQKMQQAIHEHPLMKVDPNIVYQQYQGRWTCDGCRASPGNSQMPYHCTVCNYDLCDNCYQGHRHPRHAHPLYPMNMDRVYPEFAGGWKCDHCGRSKSQLQQNIGYHCPIDQFDLCHDCFHGKLHPIHVHKLVPADSILMYGDSTGMWRCDSCTLNGNQIGSRYPWHCSQCEFDACDSCMKEYNFPFHHHPLTITDTRISYSDFNGVWRCDGCGCVGRQEVAGKDKSFHCQICRHDICFTCIRRLTDWPLTTIGRPPDIPPPELPPYPEPHPFPGLMPEDEEEEPDETLRCVVCMVHRKNATIVHGTTGHICCCMQCALILKSKGEKCPICRAPIDNVIRHYTS